MQTKTRKLKANRILSLMLSVIMVFTMIPPVNVFATEQPFSIEKSNYAVDEEVIVTINPNYSYNSKDWIGLYEKDGVPSGSNPAISWWYVPDLINTYGYSFNILDPYLVVDNQAHRIGLGDYEIYYLPDDGYGVSYEVGFTIGVEVTDELISTEKTEYTFGEDVVINYNYPVDSSSWAWVGLYKKDEVPGSVESIAWKYSCYLGEQFVLAGEDGLDFAHPERFTAGNYVLYVFAAESPTSIIYSCEFKVVATETGRVITPPTCETNGQIVVSYSDGTTVTTTAEDDPNLAMFGHDYDGDDEGEEDDWIYNGKENKTHTKTCLNCTAEGGCADCADAVITYNCTFGDAEITIPAEGAEPGEKTYTCSVCGGTYTEQYFNKVVTGTEVIEAATCQKEGTLRTYYADSTYSDSAIAKLDHEWSDWKHVEGTETHEKVCMKDGTETGHKETGNCNKSLTSTANGVFEYTCSECKHIYPKTVLSVNKTVYNYREPIMVSLDYTSAGDTWVGLYRKGDVPGTPYQEAFFWNYLRNISSPFNLIDSGNKGEDISDIRWAQYVGGEYTIILFSNGNYDVATSIDITIVAKEIGRERTEPTCETDGKIVVTYSDNTTKTITASEDATLKATGHAYSENWTFDKETKTHIKVCANPEATCEKHILRETCEFDTGVITNPPTETTLGEKTFTCGICNGKYTEPFTDKEIERTETLKEPTCLESGIIRYWFADDLYIDSEIPVIAHEWSDWQCTGTGTHEKVCKKDGTETGHTLSESCERNAPVPNISKNEVAYTCSVCDSGYTTPILSLGKSQYATNEEIDIILNSDWQGNKAWVGIYKADESPEDITSIFWYYQDDYGEVVSDVRDTDISNNRWGEFHAGEYKAVLLNNDAYDVLTSVPFTVVPSDMEYYVSVNGQNYESGDEFTVTSNDTITLVVDSDEPMDYLSWVGLYSGKMDEETEFSADAPSLAFKWLESNRGNRINIKEMVNEGGIPYGTFSIVVFGGAGETDYDDVKSIVTFTIELETVDGIIKKAPTCTTWGTAYVEYEDGTKGYMPIEPLGHDVKDWTFDKENHKHIGVCTRIDCGITIVENCEFDDGVAIENGKLYTCEVCNGTYTEESSSGGEGSTDELPVETTQKRAYGETRAETAFIIADELKAAAGVDKFEAVIIVDGMNFADALSGSFLAVQKKAPTLMFTGKNLTELQTYVAENMTSDGVVYILGGTKAVPTTVEAGFTGYTVKRLAGETRYETNLEILKEAGVTNEEIIVSTGLNFADSLSAAASGKPILLVDGKGKLAEAQKEYLESLETSQFYLIGGEKAVSAAVERELKAFGDVERIGGETRYETSVMVADKFISDPKGIILAYGKNFPDGLCGGPLAAIRGFALIIVENGQESFASEYADVYDIEGGIVLGGEGLISDETVRNIFDMESGDEIIEVK